MSLEDIRPEQLSLLASVLHQPPFESILHYEKRVQDILPELDPSLLRPDFLHRLVHLPQSFYTPLCGLHKSLNAKTIHAIFILLATEVGVRLNRLVVAGRDKVGHEVWDCNILNLRSLHGAWLQPDVMARTFGHALSVPEDGYADDDYMLKWPYEKDKCEACILAKVGGDLDTVLDLHMVASSRVHRGTSRRAKLPRLLGLCEEWLEIWRPRLKTSQWIAKLEQNELRAASLESLRREMAKGRRRATRKSHRSHRSRSSNPRHYRPSNPNRTRSYQTQLQDYGRLGAHVDLGADQRQSSQLIDVYLSPDVNQDTPTDSEQSDDEAGEAEQQAYDAEHEIIDCYDALISTPFLPGMDRDEHKKRASILSRSSTGTHSRGGNDVSSLQDVYVPPRQQWKETNDLGKSQSTNQKRDTDQTWVTMSVAPSTLSTQLSRLELSKSTKHAKPMRFESKFRTIGEEDYRESRYEGDEIPPSPVSPMTVDDQQWEKRYVDDPRISLVSRSSNGTRSKSASRMSNSKSCSHRQHDIIDADSDRRGRDSRMSTRVGSRISTVPDLPTTMSLRDSNSTIRDQSVKGRLSRPWDESEHAPGGVLDLVRQMRGSSSPSLPPRGRESTAHGSRRQSDSYHRDEGVSRSSDSHRNRERRSRR